MARHASHADLLRSPKALGASTMARRSLAVRNLEAFIHLYRAKIRWLRQALARDVPQPTANTGNNIPGEICRIWRNFSGRLVSTFVRGTAAYLELAAVTEFMRVSARPFAIWDGIVG